MKKMLAIVLVLVLVMIGSPSGNVVAQSSCQDGNGWLWFEIAPSMPTDNMTFPLTMKGDLKVYQVCINGDVYKEDISGGNYEISGLGTGIITIKSHAKITSMSLYTIPLPIATNTPTTTATPVMTATSVATATTIATETPIATATSVATATSTVTETATLSATKPIVFITIGLLSAIAVYFIITAAKAIKKKKR